MGLVSQSVKNLKGGISQQPDILRHANQGEIQINGWSSETDGLQKRPPSVFIKHLGPDSMWAGKPAVHLINRDAAEQYLAVFDGTGVSVMDLQGNPYTVRGYNGYANCANPRNDLRMVTVADYTFITNRTVAVGMNSTLTHAGAPRLDGRALINVRGGQYGRTLKVGVNVNLAGAQATVVIPDGSQASHITETDAQVIAGHIKDQLTTALGPSGWTFEAGPGWVSITAPANDNIRTIVTADGYANQLINGLIYQVQSFTKLPAQAPNGYMVEITGENSASGDNYWVQYDAAGQVWKETVKPGIISGFDPATMPHALVRAADGQFDWIPLDWGERTCGDDTTNPMPSFLDGKVNDVFFFRNRLGFLSGENVVMSRVSKYFDFFPASVATLSDDDPIDVAVSHNRVSILKYAVPYSEQLLLWSDQAQFVLTANGVLSAKNIQLDLTTEFDVSDNARPFGIGRGVFFVSPRASFSSIKRYYAVQDVSDVKAAEDTTAHVPNYIPNTVYALHGSGTENFLTVLSDNATSSVFVYKYLYLEENLVQQSWSHWDMGDDTEVMAAVCIGSLMWMILRRAGGITLERVEFTKFNMDLAAEPYRAFLDMKSIVTPTVYDDDAYTTRITFSDVYGFTPLHGDFYVLDSQGFFEFFPEPEGGWGSSGGVYLTGNRTGETFIIGRKLSFTYKFSKFLIKQSADDGSTSTEDIGRLQLRRAWVNYEGSSAFGILVDNGSVQFNYTMAGGRLGSSITTGQLSMADGQFKFPVSGDAKRQNVYLTSDSPGPVNIIGCGWEANYMRRSSGI